jgi:hypothetical protein
MAWLSDHEQFVNAIAFKDSGTIGWLVKVALQNKKGIHKIVHQLELSFQGLYNVKSFMKDNSFSQLVAQS